jgi:tetratricopeptide (TPR) repeat protein
VRSTDGHEGKGRGKPDRPSEAARDEAAELVDAADALIEEVLSPGRWPQTKTAERFLEGDRLQRVLSLYEQAMRLDPAEPAYPWNLASTLNRVGVHDLAIGYMARAIQVAGEVGDDEWAGVDAYLGLAEIALEAGETDLALTALASALEAAPGNRDVQKATGALLKSISEATGDSRPHVALAERLERIPA